ncbi:non-hydrolyzing UDP-N-acetylglucosamine 2-epimerase [Caballeronia insecticola]|uniref:UDP-N-acetylglucosamine 2-epimerase (non-hydrolyzing) n=1 Tax=Caballeronia insecticola TaxID=758793 RepID=R4X163_9BURK|nr:UDP-N-acetylglucosamine 2-epimerase (non-hydrolyzing) [Caballeronia insecticola]BAN28070.1 UDP-N-acetylglucosamine 2-epimerase [Caballeronia insecticola]
MNTKRKTILSIFGTRPEAIKMAPLVKALEAEQDIRSVVCVTGQHRSMLQQVLDLFDITPHYDLALMSENQSLNGLTSRLMSSIDDVISRETPDRVLVHGDTTTATAAALAAFHRQVPVVHIEAGLRTGDMQSPWPEEMNRRIVDVMSELMFVPTPRSLDNLAGEKLHGRAYVTGNTVIDALRHVTARIDSCEALRRKLDARFPFLDSRKQLVLVTGHRRESFGQGLRDICAALARIAKRRDVQIVYPVHLNPNVQATVISALGEAPNVFLIEPQDYMGFVRLLQRSTLVLTDSGGVQEEAPSLGKPVLVMRDVTERPEAIDAGTAMLVGTDSDAIASAVSLLLDDEDARAAFSRNVNPYGDGRASARIVAALMGRPFEEFRPAPSLRTEYAAYRAREALV